MKKTCNNCKAFNSSFDSCDLGHKIEIKDKIDGIINLYIPSERIRDMLLEWLK